MAVRSTELEELFRASHRRLLLSMYAITGNLAEAQDVVADAFVVAVSRRDKVLSADNPQAWLQRVARNIAASRWRRALRLRSLLPKAAPPDPVSAEISPDRVALMAAIRQLPRGQAEAVALHYIADLPIDEIAEIQGVAVGTVKARLHRARTTLAGSLSPTDFAIAGGEFS